MKRLLLVLALFVVTAAVMPSCAAKHFTKIWLANWTGRPFQPNGGDDLGDGGSRAVLDLKHGSTANITVQRGGITVVTIVAKSLVDKSNAADLEAGIKLYEPSSG